MPHTPMAPTAEEIHELSQCSELQEYWGGFDTAEELEACLKEDYIVKFNFTNKGSPEYSGDLFIIQSDHLSWDIPTVRLIRGYGGKLGVLYN